MAYKRKLTDEETDVKEFVVEQKKDTKKKAYRVVLLTKGKVWYEVSPTGGNSTTPDIWNGKLKVDDTIYLEE